MTGAATRGNTNVGRERSKKKIVLGWKIFVTQVFELIPRGQVDPGQAQEFESEI